MSTEPTFQELLSNFSDEIFVGRTDQLVLFEQLFTAVRPPFLILAISGQGGVGKTTLLEQFGQIADQHKAYHVLVNEDLKSVLDALASFAEQFRCAGKPCTTFDERYHKYRELKEQVEADPKAPKGFLDFAVRSATRIGMRTLHRIPLAGDAADVLLSPEAEEQIINESSAFAAYLAQKFTNKDERVLLGESVKELTSHFLTDISKLATSHRVILFFDTYERTDSYLDTWLRDLVAGKYGTFHGRVSIVIAGRYPLGQPWTAFRRAIRQVELDPFTEDEAREYLERSGIADEAQIANFIKLSDRLPVLLAMLTFAPGKVPADLSANAVERFLQGMTVDEREIALCSAVPRYFNRDSLVAILGHDRAIHAFNWLIEAHFVRQGEKGWHYHDVVRTLLLRYILLRSSTQYAQMNEQMVAYYDGQLVQLCLPIDQQRTNRYWRSIEAERLYHIVATQPGTKLVNLLDSLLLTTLAELEKGTDCLEICNILKQTIQIITQLNQEIHNEVLVNWSTYADNLLSAGDDLTKLIRVARTFLPLILAVHPPTELAKHAAWLLLAELHKDNEEWPEALQASTHAIQICPNRPYGYTIRATIYYELEQYDNALLDCTTAIELQPEDDYNYYWRGRIYFEISNAASAITDFSRAIELKPDDSDNYQWRGSILNEIGDHTTAIADLTKAIELQPNGGDNYFWRGTAYHDGKNYSAAIADLSKAIEIGDDNSHSYHLRGLVYYDSDNYAAAITDFSKAIELQPDNCVNYHLRGRAYYKISEYTTAITDFTKAIELQPEDSYNFFWRGWVHYVKSDYNSAVGDISKAIEIQPNDYYNFFWRGMALHELGNDVAAITDFTKAIELQPNNAYNYRERGHSYYCIEDYN
jgi:tetratricopeptide (TPR) repeat protein